MMIFINAVYKEDKYPKYMAEDFIKLLNPIAPFMTEEIWEKMGHHESIANASWPTFDPDKTVDDEITIGIQVNGKLRGEITIAMDEEDEDIKQKALNNENVKKHLEGKEIIKVIIIKGKIVNIVVK